MPGPFGWGDFMRNETLGEYFKRLRLDADLSQRDISNRLGYKSPQFVSNWERGLVTPPAKQVRKLAKMFSVDPGVIIDRMVDAYWVELKKTVWP